MLKLFHEIPDFSVSSANQFALEYMEQLEGMYSRSHFLSCEKLYDTHLFLQLEIHKRC